MAKKRKTPSINGSSSADIAFMLLIFFLVTTSMGSDKGLARILPPPIPPDQEDVSIDVNKRNMLRVLVNAEGLILCNGEETSLDALKERVKEFVLNENNDPNLPVLSPIEVPMIGEILVTKNHVVSVTNDVDTKYKDYVAVQSTIAQAYGELRNEYAMRKWGKKFSELDEERQKILVRDVFPQKISEANPKEYGK